MDVCVGTRVDVADGDGGGSVCVGVAGTGVEVELGNTMGLAMPQHATSMKRIKIMRKWRRMWIL
jgi:hypothetical protein